MKRFILVAVLSVTNCLAAFAVDPPIVPKNVSGKVGDFVIIKAENKGKATKFVSLSDGLVVFPSGLLKDNHTTVVIAQSPGSYTVLAYTAKGDEPSDPAYIIVSVGVEPGPVPPLPVPVPPTDRFGLVKASKDGLAKVKTDQATVQKFAGVQRGFAAAIAAGTYKTPSEIFNGWRSVNQPFGVDVWGQWGVVVSAQLQKAYTDGLLKVNADWVEAFRDIARGLDGK